MTKTYDKNVINTRQLCFLIAFLFPIARFLEAPRLLASAVGGDLLWPVLFSSCVQALPLAAFVAVSSKTDKTLYELLQAAFGRAAAKIVYFLLALYFLFAAVIPLLDADKFSYAAFFDTAPTTFAFAPFFILSAFLGVKNFKAIGRSADLCLFLFLIPFVGILVLAWGASDFSALLPVLSNPIAKSVRAVGLVKPHFADGAFLLPLLGRYRYEKGEAKKIALAFTAGTLFTLLFFAFFYGVYTTIAPREHYAFAKIAQYFPALAVVGRIDLLLVYLLSIVYIFYVCLPLQCAVDCLSIGLEKECKGLLSTLLHIGLFFFVLFFNQRYDMLYRLFTERLSLVFFVFADLLPLTLLPLILLKKTGAGTK